MRLKVSKIASTCLIFLLCTCSAAFAQKIYVSVKGADGNTGTSVSPVATIQKAVELAATYYAKSNGAAIQVFIGPGTYMIASPLTFGEHFANPKNVIKLIGDPTSKPVLSGGFQITNFKKDSGGLWKAETEKGNKPFEQLYVNDIRAQRARTPNKAYSHPLSVSESILKQGLGKIAEQAIQSFKLSPSDFEKIQKLSDDELQHVIAKFYHNWDNTIKPLQAINRNDSSFSVSGKGMKSWNRIKQQSFLTFENAKEFLDEPGEWYLEKDGTLFYYPRNGEEMDKIKCFAPASEKLVIIKGSNNKIIQNITFQNLDFQIAGYNLPDNTFEPSQSASALGAAIELDFAENIHFENCDISKTGANAIWFRRGCSNSSVSQCRLYDLGAGAIKIGETVRRQDSVDVTNHITVSDNTLKSGGRVLPSAAALIVFNARDNLITHNEVTDFFYTGISLGWVWGYAPNPSTRNVVTYNYIHHLGQGVLSDMGGIYTLGPSEGTLISNNVIHDVTGSQYGGWGLYCDEGSSGITLEKNLVYHCGSAGFHQHYGENNVVKNNIFAFNGQGELQLSKIEDHKSLTFINNIVYASASDVFLSNWGKAEIESDFNCYWSDNSAHLMFGKRPFTVWQKSGHDQNSLVANPSFVGPSSHNFHFKDKRAIQKIGFIPFDYEQAGVRGRRYSKM